MNNEKHKQAYLLNLFNSPLANEIKESVELLDINEAETNLRELLDNVSDSSLKFEIDSAVGAIAAAYEKLGFIVGCELLDNQ